MHVNLMLRCLLFVLHVHIDLLPRYWFLYAPCISVRGINSIIPARDPKQCGRSGRIMCYNVLILLMMMMMRMRMSMMMLRRMRMRMRMRMMLRKRRWSIMKLRTMM